MSAPATPFCSTCGLPFLPRRSTRRFCSSRCRLINHRGSALRTPPRPAGERASAFLSVASTQLLLAPLPKKRETLSGLKQPPPGILRDERYPAMYRVILPDGSLSDMLNLTRAKDAFAVLRDQAAAMRGTPDAGKSP